MRAIILAIFILCAIASNAQEQFFKDATPLAQYARSACGLPKCITLAILAHKTNYGEKKYDISKLVKFIRENKEKYQLDKLHYWYYVILISEQFFNREDEFAGEVIAIIKKHQLHLK